MVDFQAGDIACPPLHEIKMKSWYPRLWWDGLAVCDSFEVKPGGYPFATGIVAILGEEQFEKKPRSHWQWITAHEIGHQYWGEYVMDTDSPAWLWIGLGIYADHEYSRARGVLGPAYSQCESPKTGRRLHCSCCSSVTRDDAVEGQFRVWQYPRS